MQSRFEERLLRWYERLSIRRAVGTIIGVALTIVLAGGLLERLVEPETFTSLGLAYWFAIVTVTTVGYGDVVPHTVGGRIVATTIMLTGLSMIPTLTSAIVSILVTKRSRREIDHARDLAEEHVAVLERIEGHLERIERSASA
jgi:voltage-gated potassium channel